MKCIKVVKCIKGNDHHKGVVFSEAIKIESGSRGLTDGYIYSVFDEKDGMYLLGEHGGIEHWYHKKYFVEV